MARLTRAFAYDRLPGFLPVRVRSDRRRNRPELLSWSERRLWTQCGLGRIRRKIGPSYFRGAKGDYGPSGGRAGSAGASAIARASGPRPGNGVRFPRGLVLGALYVLGTIPARNDSELASESITS
jgi:hypothetical protein